MNTENNTTATTTTSREYYLFVFPLSTDAAVVFSQEIARNYDFLWMRDYKAFVLKLDGNTTEAQREEFRQAIEGYAKTHRIEINTTFYR